MLTIYRDLTLVNVSLTLGFFMSPPVRWEYNYTLDLVISTVDNKEENISIYEITNIKNEKLFSIY